ncbi:hypothetical protein [Clostridium sp.]|uniref:hypothetical protein n=1 Tax=Clostridium sp. TaxID=1506 RepID=UPI0025C39C86|nr:hypothetical protein [Clostridium sp.]
MATVNKGILTKFYTDSDGNVISIKVDREQSQVSSINYVVTLEGIPEEFNRVTCINKNTGDVYTEVNSLSALQEGCFYVDYQLGKVYFNSTEAGKVVLFNYYSQGYELISTTRVFDETAYRESDIVKTLQDIIDAGRKGLDYLENIGQGDTLVTQLQEQVRIGNTCYSNLKSTVDRGDSLNVTLEANIQTATTKNTTLVNNLSTVDSKNSTLTSTINNARTAEGTLNSTVDNANSTNTTLNNTIKTGNTLNTNLKNSITQANQSLSDLNTAISSSDLSAINTTLANLQKYTVVVGTIAELQTAVANVGRAGYASTILIKAGTYTPTRSFELCPYTHIAPLGDGEVIFKCNNSSVNNIFRNELDGTEIGYEGTSHITIEGITFDGVNTVNTITPVAFAHAVDCKVINCTFKNFNTWHNIEFNGCNYCYAERCTFLNYGLTSGGTPTEVVQIDYCGSSAQYPWNCNYDNTSCDHIYIRHCEFRDIIGACLGNHAFTGSVRQNNIYFEYNYIVNADYGVFMGDANNVFIKNNKTEKVRMFVECKEGSGLNLFNWYIEQNDVDLVKGETFHGIEMGVNTEGRFCRFEATNSSSKYCINGLFINNNHINNANTHGITFTANFVECNNNFIRGCGKIGIFAYGCSQGVIMNNVIADCGSNNVTNRNFAIAIGDNGSFPVWRISCANNVCYNIAVFGGTTSTYVHDNIGKVVEINNPSYVNNNNHDV